MTLDERNDNRYLENLTFQENNDSFVECEASGGIPAPVLQLIETSTNRTFGGSDGSAHKQESFDTNSGERGLRLVSNIIRQLMIR